MIGPFDLLSFESRQSCSGCAACESVCPENAITMEEDSEGFVIAIVDTEKCVNCGKCEQVCPVITVNKHPSTDSVYACYSRNEVIRNNASSGGVFELLARKVISENGIVFGAAFDKQLFLNHTYVDNLEDLKKLTKSKYIQSNTSGVFPILKQFLLLNKKVLFVGTPCQVSALSNYLGEPYEQLITVDLVCHGVPSNRTFQNYKEAEEKKRGGEMKNFSFRVKDGSVKHVHGYEYTIHKKGKVKRYRGMYFDNPYYFAFKKYLILRPSCYSCKYCSPERVSDITLADFWGIEKYSKRFDFEKGVSMVLINTEKGQKLFEVIAHEMESQRLAVDVAIENNYCLSKPTRRPKNHESFMEDFRRLPFEILSKKRIMSKKKILYRIYYRLPKLLKKKISRKLKEVGYV